METGFNHLANCLFDWTGIILQPHYESLRASARKRSLDDVLAGKQLLDEAPNLTPDEEFLTRIFREFSEVFNTLEALRDTQVYLSRFPFGRTRVTKGRYLAHQISIYFQEIYILRVRLVRLARTVKDGLSAAGRRQHADEKIGPLFKLIKQGFGRLEETRGSHVHNRRFSDDDLSRLQTIDLLARTMPEAKPRLEEIHREVRAKWVSKIRGSITSIEAFMDTYADRLWEGLFAQSCIFDMAKLTERRKARDG